MLPRVNREHAEKTMSGPDPQRLREYRQRADLKRCRNLVQARLPTELADRFRRYMQANGLNKNQALISIARNYARCEANAEQLRQLQQWITDNKAAVDRANAEAEKKK